MWQPRPTGLLHSGLSGSHSSTLCCLLGLILFGMTICSATPTPCRGRSSVYNAYVNLRRPCPDLVCGLPQPPSPARPTDRPELTCASAPAQVQQFSAEDDVADVCFSHGYGSFLLLRLLPMARLCVRVSGEGRGSVTAACFATLLPRGQRCTVLFTVLSRAATADGAVCLLPSLSSNSEHSTAVLCALPKTCAVNCRST